MRSLKKTATLAREQVHAQSMARMYGGSAMDYFRLEKAGPAAAERERCARIADKLAPCGMLAAEIAAKIRAAE